MHVNHGRIEISKSGNGDLFVVATHRPRHDNGGSGSLIFRHDFLEDGHLIAAFFGRRIVHGERHVGAGECPHPVFYHFEWF